MIAAELSRFADIFKIMFIDHDRYEFFIKSQR